MRYILCSALLAAFVAGGSATGDDGEPNGKFWSAKELTVHYVAQVAKLRAAGYPELFGGSDSFEQRFNVNPPVWSLYKSLYGELGDAAPVWVDDGNIPFLIVVPDECAPLLWQITRVKIGGIKADALQFPLAKIANAKSIAAPRRKPYLIFNVERGANSAHTSVMNAEWEFANADRPRRGFTFTEGIALLIQYPDAVKCERGMDEDCHEHFAYGHPVFVASYYGAESRDPKDGEALVFILRKDGLQRGFFAPVLRRDMAPNYTRFLFPSCDIAPTTEVEER